MERIVKNYTLYYIYFFWSANFAFLPTFGYNSSMYCFRIIASIILMGFFSFSVWAEDWYIGENPGTNFYSTIDEWDYQITAKILTKRLAEKPTLDKFGAECLGKTWVKDAPTDIKTLEEIAKGDYRKLTEILKKNNIENISIDTYQGLALCLTEKYQRAKSRARDEQNNIETLSSLGLYMDGDTSNSDYDIISDIEKINMIIFSKNLKYSGEINKSASSFRDFLSGRPVAALFGSGTPAGIAWNTGSWGTGSWGTGGTGSWGTWSGWVNLGTLIGGSCGWSTTSQDITDIIDDAFARELAATLASGPIGYPTGQWYTRNVWAPPQGTLSGTNANGTHTSADDFFHKMPCTSIFCIDVTMVSGSQNLLGGGKMSRSNDFSTSIQKSWVLFLIVLFDTKKCKMDLDHSLLRISN